jgi:hypothetical protein
MPAGYRSYTNRRREEFVVYVTRMGGPRRRYYRCNAEGYITGGHSRLISIVGDPGSRLERQLRTAIRGPDCIRYRRVGR